MKNNTNGALENLTPYQPRQFLPESVDLTQKDIVVGFYQQLLDRSLETVDALESLLRDRSELESAMGQASSILYIRMTSQTDDPERAEAYKNYIETVVPAIKPLDDQLDRKVIQAVDALDFSNPY